MTDPELKNPVVTERGSFSHQLKEALSAWQDAGEKEPEEALRELVSLVEQAILVGNDVFLKVRKEAAGQKPNNVEIIGTQGSVEEKDDGWVFSFPGEVHGSTQPSLILTRWDNQIAVKGIRMGHFAWFSGGDVVSLTCQESKDAEDLPDLRGKERWAIGGKK